MRNAYQAYHDALTDLPNRAQFKAKLKIGHARAQRHQTPLAVLFLDLDNFKFINDSLGHKVGDELLVIIAERLKSCVRQYDTVARLGGDEFTVLMEVIHSVEEAILVAERIIEALRSPVKLQERDIFATASVGIVYATKPPDQPESLLCDADVAMYHAKAKGRAGYSVFDSLMNDSFLARMATEAGLHIA